MWGLKDEEMDGRLLRFLKNEDGRRSIIPSRISEVPIDNEDDDRLRKLLYLLEGFMALSNAFQTID